MQLQRHSSNRRNANAKEYFSAAVDVTANTTDLAVATIQVVTY